MGTKLPRPIVADDLIVIKNLNSLQSSFSEATLKEKL